MDFFDDPIPLSELALQALQHSPEDAAVLAITSQLDYVHQGNIKTSMSLASRSVETDPTEPMGWALLSNAMTNAGRRREGYEAALRAIKLSGASPSRYYFEHFACMAAASLGAYDDAMLHATMALRFRPDFVSARRYEVVLNLQRRDAAGAEMSISALRKHEPNFVPLEFLDPNYPVTTLRRLPLIDAIRQRA